MTVSQDATNSDIDVSIIIPLYYNQDNIGPTFQAIYEEVIQSSPQYRFEIVLVNDGSPDDTWARVENIKKEHPLLVTTVDLIRNYGQTAAIKAGYSVARGKCMVNIDADLQDPPEVLNRMIDTYFTKNCRIVIANRNGRNESLYRRITSGIFYGLVRRLCFSNIPRGGFNLFLVDRFTARFILRQNDPNHFIQGHLLSLGFPMETVCYTRQKRVIGESRLTFSKKARMFTDALFSYTYIPIRLMSVLGTILSSLGFLWIILLVINRIWWGYEHLPFKGWAPIMIATLLLNGFSMQFLGIIGEYLWRLVEKNRTTSIFLINHVNRAGDDFQGYRPSPEEWNRTEW